MIIGNGLLADAFRRSNFDSSDLIIFASGVSNSKEVDFSKFLREKKLLESFFSKETKIIYFSTCSIEDDILKSTPYVQHKVEIESMLAKQSSYLIFRLPQVVGFTNNQNTLTNFIYNKIKSNQHFDLLADARRNIIDVDDVVKIAKYVLSKDDCNQNRTMNIASSKSITVLELVKIYEQILGLKAKYNLIKGGSSYSIDVTECMKIALELGIYQDDIQTYIRQVLTKYYKNN